ncbi:MAG: mannose-1-phosphate guanylyltransferase [Candidatus Cloacimonetes bacterium 4572_55]|nr:MAG: mannose-1-phosphate guanylyltransferase [Candidatus Cloacimonetes bacterium 4572_55]
MYIVIMAGGKGTRFWPLSRGESPKQLLNICGERSMIQETVHRVLPLVPTDRILVVTAAAHADEIRRQLPNIPDRNILEEPVGRNTAPCIGLAATHLARRDPDAVMIVLPADHLIKDEEPFRETLIHAAQIAEKSANLITIGITPTWPETGYGYIQLGDAREYPDFKSYQVKSFREKPNAESAEEFIKSGDFVWNSGMFIWRASTILANIERFLPRIYRQLLQIRVSIGSSNEQSTLNRIYPRIEPQSIDFGVMERSSNVFSLRGNFRWNDVGSWNALGDVWQKDEHGNACYGKPAISVNATKSIVFSPKKQVALVHVDNLIVVETDDALLVCRSDKAQDVKKIVELLEEKGMTELL